MIKCNDLKIDPVSLGSPMLLVDVTPVYAYDGGHRTSQVVGHKYQVSLPAHRMKKLGVKIDGPQQMARPDEPTEVVFTGLEIGLWEIEGSVRLSAKATGIRPAKAAPKS